MGGNPHTSKNIYMRWLFLLDHNYEILLFKLMVKRSNQVVQDSVMYIREYKCSIHFLYSIILKSKNEWLFLISVLFIFIYTFVKALGSLLFPLHLVDSFVLHIHVLWILYTIYMPFSQHLYIKCTWFICTIVRSVDAKIMLKKYACNKNNLVCSFRKWLKNKEPQVEITSSNCRREKRNKNGNFCTK